MPRLFLPNVNIWLLLLIAWASSADAGLAYKDKAQVIVLPFNEKTGKDTLGIDGLAIKASVVDSLKQVTNLQVIFDVSGATRQLDIANKDVTDLNNVIKLSTLTKVHWIIWGYYENDADKLLDINIHMYDANPALGLTNITVVSSDWTTAQQEITGKILNVLGTAETQLDKLKFQEVWDISLPARELYAKAIKAGEAGQSIEKQEASLKEAITIQPNYMDAYVALAQRLMSQGLQDSAQAVIDAGLNVNSNCAALLEDKGIVLTASRQFVEAENSLYTASELAPDDPQILIALGDAEAYRGMGKEAIKHFIKAFQLNPYGDSASLAEKRIDYWKPRQTQTYFPTNSPEEYSDESLTTLINDKLSVKDRGAVVYPIAGNDEMKKWAQALTRDATNQLQSYQMLFDALCHHPYALSNTSRTAQDVFALWNQNVPFNCRDFTYLYVALARELSLNAYVVEVFKRCDDNETPHVCSGIFINGQLLLVDLTYEWFGVPHKSFRVLNNLQVIALYLCQTYDVNNCQIAYALSPELDFVRENLITALMRVGSWQQAAEIFRSSTYSNSRNWVTNCIEAEFALHQNRDEEAISYLEKAVALSPNSGNSWYLLGCAYLRQHQLVKSRDSFQRALGCDVQEDCAIQCRQAITQIDHLLTPNTAIPKS